MRFLWLLCIAGIILVLALAYNGKCGGVIREGLGGGGGRGGGGGGRGGGGGGRGGGGFGGGRGGGGFGGGRGGRGGWGGGGRGGGRGWHGGGWRGRGRWRGNVGSGWSGGYWPWWWEWWNDPFYYTDLPYGYDNIDQDRCDCFGKYKAAVDGGVTKEVASNILETCVKNTLSGGPCS